uniref:Zinc finger CCCH domain-containing protein 33-like isoform X2 n=1 Tax=Cymbidium ensifolium TaxID=78740 RepID=A0A5J6N8F1_CYMEN|nr:zinc finger CCCH domain-containing protein 33-like isoform X2 [Cymbidium ensifolium]
MSRGPSKPCPPPAAEAIALLLELSAADDVAAFKLAVEKTDLPLDSSGPWYSRSVGPASSPSRRMGYELRSPLEIAALYGSTAVLSYILGRKSVDVNRPCGSDGAAALHCAAAGGCAASLHVVKLLIEASADVDAVDAMGSRPGDVIAKQFSASVARELELLLKAPCPRVSSPRNKEKKEYPPDSTLPDIKNGIYGKDEFRMYTFKVKPCSRAYSHDWTECPFVHPGENARRRDPRKYSYSCVPCPEFRKGTCLKGDTCEYAHGVFESWLHPAQYRTRLCKDEIGCGRRVCFFAHRKEELRTVNPTMASVSGLGLSSPKMSPMAVSSLDMAAALLMSPSASSAMGSSPAWLSPAANMVQLPSSRLSSSPSFRNLDFDPDLMGLEGFEQKLLDGISNASSPPLNWKANSLKQAAGAFTGNQMKQQQLLLSGYGSNLPSSPGLNSSSSFSLDHFMATKAIATSKQSAFAKRSQSFIDREAPSRHTIRSPPPSFCLSDWVSPDGKLDWGIQVDELNKLRQSATFNARSNESWPKAQAMAELVPPLISRPEFKHYPKQNQSNGAGDFLSWEQLYAAQEQLVA